MKVPSKPDRRTVLRAGAAGTVALVVLPACGPNGADLPSGPIPAGNVADINVGTLRLVSGANAILGRDANGLYAMSAVCTHSGCVVTPPGDSIGSIDCLCHGSVFNRDGARLGGPASGPLQNYRVDVAADMSITIQADIKVAAGTRTAV